MPHTRRFVVAVLVLATLLAAACSSDDAASDADTPDGSAGGTATTSATDAPTGVATDAGTGLRLIAVSTQPDDVTGGDVLLEVRGADTNENQVGPLTIDGRPAEDLQWSHGDDPTVLRVLVRGLSDGDHELAVPSGDETATLTVTDHPAAGPVFSGPHLPLEACSTETYGLGPADEDCMVDEPVITWSYVNTAGERVDLDDPTDVPDDADTMADGTTPLILREERGTINRSVYWITVPDPHPDAQDPTTFDPSAFNGRLVYEFGGGCGVTYAQGFKLLGDADLELMRQGYAHATATFNTFQVTCNSVISAETTMMVKEHFAEAYAVPELTIGTGGSGGAIQQLQIVQNYPGLLDAAAPLLPFPDAISIATDVLDCGLLERYQRDGGGELTDEEFLAVTGHRNAGTSAFWEQTFVPNVNPTTGCTLDLLSAASGLIDGLDEGVPPSVDDSLAYDADTNPDGLRCTLQDGNVNILGRDPDTGFARRPWDNVGLQYGLAALNNRDITVEQFLALNDGIGSFDIDGQWTDRRAAADEDTIATAYHAGAVNQGAGDLRRIPIIEVNVWTDDEGDIHTRDRAFTARERVRLDDGTLPPNFMLWTRGLPAGETMVDSLTGSVGLGAEVIGVLDEWATAMADEIPDRAGATDEELTAALEATRPADAVDNCITAEGERVSALDLYDQPGPCTDPYPVSSTPRRVAGTPLIHDILKCQLQSVTDAVDAGLYDVDLTDEQIARLEAIFPDGVCDFTVPGVGQVDTLGPWQDYTDGPAGTD